MIWCVSNLFLDLEVPIGLAGTTYRIQSSMGLAGEGIMFQDQTCPHSGQVVWGKKLRKRDWMPSECRERYSIPVKKNSANPLSPGQPEKALECINKRSWDCCWRCCCVLNVPHSHSVFHDHGPRSWSSRSSHQFIKSTFSFLFSFRVSFAFSFWLRLALFLGNLIR